MNAPLVEVHDNADALATAVAGELLDRLADAQASGHVPQIALTGGGIAEAVHRELARLSAGLEVDWTQVVVWWGDERFVEPASPDRNDAVAMTELFEQVDPNPANLHPMPSTETAETAEAGAAAYGEELRRDGAGEFDVVMLGVGPDGHVASLFPGHPALDVDDAIAVAIHDSPKPPSERISLTIGALNRARCVWFLVSGEEKANAVAAALAEGTDLHDVPAAGLAGREETIWFLDRDAAAQL